MPNEGQRRGRLMFESGLVRKACMQESSIVKQPHFGRGGRRGPGQHGNIFTSRIDDRAIQGSYRSEDRPLDGHDQELDQRPSSEGHLQDPGVDRA